MIIIMIRFSFVIYQTILIFKTVCPVLEYLSQVILSSKSCMLLSGSFHHLSALIEFLGLTLMCFHHTQTGGVHMKE